MLVMGFCGEKDLSLHFVVFHHLLLTLSICLPYHEAITQNTLRLTFGSQAGQGVSGFILHHASVVMPRLCCHTSLVLSCFACVVILSASEESLASGSRSFVSLRMTMSEGAQLDKVERPQA